MMVRVKLLMIKHFRCFHILASLLVEGGNLVVFEILWVGAEGTEEVVGPAYKCPVPRQLRCIHLSICSKKRILNTYQVPGLC